MDIFSTETDGQYLWVVQSVSSNSSLLYWHYDLLFAVALHEPLVVVSSVPVLSMRLLRYQSKLGHGLLFREPRTIKSTES